MVTRPEVSWYPCHIFPTQWLAFDSCEVVPGITLSKIGDERAELDKAQEMLNRWPPFHSALYDWIIKLDPGLYEPALIERLREGGGDVDKYLSKKPANYRQFAFISHDAVRLVITALLLSKRLKIRTPDWHIRVQHDDAGKRRLSGFSPQREGCNDSAWLMSGHYDRVPGEVSCEQLRQTAAKIEPYFRPAFWHSDAMGVALGSYWNAAFGPYEALNFLSLAIILEALLSKDQNEISHQVGERAAVLLEVTADKRMQIYDLVKTLYDLRSSIVHGGLVFDNRKRKGGSFIDAKHTYLARESVTNMLDISMRVIWAVLDSPDLMAAITSGKGLREAYLRRIFAAPEAPA